MLEIIRSDEGEILGACEFYAVDAKGNFASDGKYCWINECEISKSAEHKGLLKQFAQIITSKYLQFQWGYFWRKNKYPARSPRIYTRYQWQNL